MNFKKIIFIQLLLGSIAINGMQQQLNELISHFLLNKLVDPPQVVRDFVLTSLSEIDFHPSKLVIKCGIMKLDKFFDPDWDWSARVGSTITIPRKEIDPELCGNLFNLLKKQKDTHQQLTDAEKEKINWYKAVIQHEGTHLKNNDQMKLLIAGLVTSGVGTLFVLSVFKWLDFPAATTLQSVAQLAAKGFVTINYFIIILLISRAYSRYLEQRADDGIADNIEILQATANDCRKQVDNYKISDEYYGVSFKERIFRKFFDTHPANEQRAQRFEQRIAKLKLKQQ